MSKFWGAIVQRFTLKGSSSDPACRTFSCKAVIPARPCSGSGSGSGSGTGTLHRPYGTATSLP